MKLPFVILLAVFINTAKRKNRSADQIKTLIDTSHIIKEIKTEYSEINLNEKKYKLLEKDLMGETTEGGIVSAFCDKDVPREIVAVYYRETGKTIEKYYFNKTGLFFAFSQNFIYDKPIDQPGFKVVDLHEDRYYFNKNTT